MNCAGCEETIKLALQQTPGVRISEVNYDRGKAVIKYDDQKVTVDKLRLVIQSTGFFCDAEKR